MHWLFRLGLSIKQGDSRFYSFCIKGWTNEGDYRHCAVCNKCCPVMTSWHCGVCRQCRHDGMQTNCYRCGGRSSIGLSREEKEYDIWRNMELEDNRTSEGRDQESIAEPDFSVRPSIEDTSSGTSDNTGENTGGNVSSNPIPLTALHLRHFDRQF